MFRVKAIHLLENVVMHMVLTSLSKRIDPMYFRFKQANKSWHSAVIAEICLNFDRFYCLKNCFFLIVLDCIRVSLDQTTNLIVSLSI